MTLIRMSTTNLYIKLILCSKESGRKRGVGGMLEHHSHIYMHRDGFTSQALRHQHSQPLLHCPLCVSYCSSLKGCGESYSINTHGEDYSL